MKQLDHLNLSRNLIGDEGARSLIPCLGLIGELHIDHCEVSDAVEEEIKSEHEKRRLTVSNCGISPCITGYQSCSSLLF